MLKDVGAELLLEVNEEGLEREEWEDREEEGTTGGKREELAGGL